MAFEYIFPEIDVLTIMSTAIQCYFLEEEIIDDVAKIMKSERLKDMS